MPQFNFCPMCGKRLKMGLIDNKVRRYCEKCGFINYINPIPSVGIIVRKENKYLLIKRGVEPGKGTWAPPSGFMESGETMEETCVRELKEETGLDGCVVELLGIYREVTKEYGDVLVIAYLMEITGGDLTSGDDALDVGYFEKSALPNIHFECFRKAIEKCNEVLDKKTAELPGKKR